MPWGVEGEFSIAGMEGYNLKLGSDGGMTFDEALGDESYMDLGGDDSTFRKQCAKA